MTNWLGAQQTAAGIQNQGVQNMLQGMGQLSNVQNNKMFDANQQNDTLTLTVPVGGGQNATYRVKAGETTFQPEILKEKYDLDKGGLFVIDFTASPPKVTQVKADLSKVLPKGRKFVQGDGPPALKQLRADVPEVEKLLK